MEGEGGEDSTGATDSAPPSSVASSGGTADGSGETTGSAAVTGVNPPSPTSPSPSPSPSPGADESMLPFSGHTVVFTGKTPPIIANSNQTKPCVALMLLVCD